jgi:hypothetical protein
MSGFYYLNHATYDNLQAAGSKEKESANPIRCEIMWNKKNYNFSISILDTFKTFKNQNCMINILVA